MTQPISQPIGDFRDQIAELAETWYEKDERKAFRHAAFQQVLPDPNVSDLQVIQLTAIDHAGDLEVDGWFVDETEESVLLFQSFAGSSKAEEAKLAKFWNAPQELLIPDRVTNSPNQSVKDLANTLDNALRLGYTLKLVFASRAGFVPSALGFAKSKQNLERVFSLLDSTSITVPTSLLLYDESGLAQRFEDYKSGFRVTTSTDVRIEVDPRMIHPVESDLSRSIRATVKATQIVEAFRSPGLGYRLFSLNPRGPLANAKVNKQIQKTLDTAEGRRVFHLLNNGLCATCDSFEIHDNYLLTAKNFQIVNGCQTTVTLADRTSDQLAETLIDLKLTVADRNLAERIAEASNSQTALRARDYASFEKQQRNLEWEFANDIMPPWFYEIKQGYWRYVLSDGEKARFKTGRRKSHIEVQPLAQASLSFLGYPDVALDRVRFVFEGIRNADEREAYETAFPTDVKAYQLLLPWTIFDSLSRDEEGGQRLRFSIFHMLWLIATFLSKHYGLPQGVFFSRGLTDRLLVSKDNWFPPLARVTNTAVTNAYRRAQFIAGGSDKFDIRSFFRASGEVLSGLHPKELLREALASELETEQGAGRSLTATLPS